MVTYEGLIQFVIMLAEVITLCYPVFKDKNK